MQSGERPALIHATQGSCPQLRNEGWILNVDDAEPTDLRQNICFEFIPSRDAVIADLIPSFNLYRLGPRPMLGCLAGPQASRFGIRFGLPVQKPREGTRSVSVEDRFRNTTFGLRYVRDIRCGISDIGSHIATSHATRAGHTLYPSEGGNEI